MNTYKIVAITQINNELRKGNLERFFNYITPLVDHVVVYDDASTDGSYEYAQGKTPYVLRGTKNSFTEEWKIKQKLVEKALNLLPDFILLIDADEVLAIKDTTKLQELASFVLQENADGAYIHDINLWRSRSWKRVDSDFDSAYFPRFWRVRDRTLTYTNRVEGLHQSPLPDQIKNLVRQDIVSFLHFGFADEKNIVAKYLQYARRGQRGENLARIINEEGLRTQKLEQSLYPEGLWVNDEQPKALSGIDWYKYIALYKDELTKPSVSIVCLIYKSTAWLQFVYDQVLKYTDLSDKEFFFVANDATPEVKQYLHDNYIPHYIFENTQEHKEEWYINNVYRAYNFGGVKAKGDFILFINSDMAFSPNWVENALSHYDGRVCVASHLVQNDKFPTNEPWFVGVEKNLGYHISDYQEDSFLSLVKEIAKDTTIPGGSYMPLLIKKEHFLKVGGYPEGNMVEGGDIFKPIIAKKGEPLMSGDVVFMKKLTHYGIKHVTALNSIAYHFQEGEKQDVDIDQLHQKPLVVIANGSLNGAMKEKVLWNFMLESLPRSVGIDYATVGADELTFSYKAKTYIDNNFPQAEIVIQNASFLDIAHPGLHTISFLQDDLRRMKRISPQQEETLLLSNDHVSNSLVTAESYLDFYFDIIPIGIDVSLFTPGDKNKSRKKYSIPESKKVGIFVGNLTDVKGWGEIAPLINKHKEIHWIVVTKGTETLQGDNISFFSRIPQSTLAELHQCADFFIIGSKVETLCLAAMEACCCNVPVIMRPVGIFAEFNKEERDKCGIFGEDFEAALSQLHEKQFNPREVFLKRKLDINHTIELWWELIARARLLKKDKKVITSHVHSKSAAFKRKIKRIFSKNYVIVVSKRNLSPKMYTSLLGVWRVLKRIKK